jgi:hypothetical protein
MWLVLALACAFLLLILFLLGSQDAARVRRDWELLLTPRDEKVYRVLERRVRFEMALAEITRAESFAELELRYLDDAKRLLDAGYEVIANFAPTLLSLVSAMALFSRTVTAIPFAPPATTAQRHRFRLYVLRRSCALLTRYVRASSPRVAHCGQPQDDDGESDFQPLRADLQALTEDTLQALRALFRKIVGERSTDALWQLAERREQWRQEPETPAMALWAALIVVALVASVLLRQL